MKSGRIERINSKPRTEKMFDFGLVTKAIVLWIVLLPVFSVVHEYGHAIICEVNNMPYNIHVGITGSQIACAGQFPNNDPTSFRMAGGFVASGIALIAFAILRKRVSLENSWIVIPLVTIGTVHYIEMILETFVHDFYMTSNITTVIMSMTSLVILMTLLARKSKQLREKRQMEVGNLV